jgi:acyl-CoA hydrolase
MVRYGDHLHGVEVVHLLTLGPAPYVAPELTGRFRHTAFFIGGNVREAVQKGRADFMPVFLSDIPRLITEGRIPIHAALIQVSPPDRHGFVSLGVSVDIIRAAVDSVEVILAEVNPNMPRTLGDSFLHVDEITKLVHVDTPLPELTAEPLDDVFREIGRHVAGLIENGATLQMGIGKIPDAVLAALFDHHDRASTAMFSDGVASHRAGVITGLGRRCSWQDRDLFVMNRARLRLGARQPAVEMRPSSFTNDPFTISRNDHMVAINAALGVDLTGQVAADTLRARFFSGIGGQVDFIRGASRSRHGRPIIALPSTARGGTMSRITAMLDEGAGVVTSRGDVHYVVTEYGVADLWGKNIRQRANALIAIAHPDFRAELTGAAVARHYLFLESAVVA